ncbi:probable cardiolipin synthase (CMP-forming) [Diachasma alloeum]|uniref:probable cardiolipin synthase (CMP-forming) n=1 Tax=Diachasma alloeum TaxID=454923 RepID=UPI0007382497|nr:probable cardiolipin synthase (CMP-forming) [Diachasma alloeum]
MNLGATRCMLLFQLKTTKLLMNKINVEKHLKHLSSRLYCNVDKKNTSSSRKSFGGEKTKGLRAKIIHEFRETKHKVEEIIERENIWTVPNLLCIGRIVSTPCLSYLIVSHDYQVALWLLGFAGLTDFVDGWIARTWTSQASKLGSFLDPMADKLLVGSLFLSLAWVELIPMPLMVLVLVRDVGLIAAASYIRYRSLPAPKTLTRYFDPTYATVQLAPTLTSKLNTAVQLSLVASTLAAPVFHFVDHPLLQGLCYLTAITTVAGGISYLMSKNTYKYLSKKKHSENPPS